MEPLAEDTFPKLLIKNAERMASRTALREKKLGIWHETSWTAYRDDVRDFALGLLGLGVGRGDKVAILGDNRPFWVCAELAAQSIGAASVGIYQDSNLNEVAYVIDHCDAKAVGRKRHATEPGLWLDEVRKGNGEELALICYTSGTTGFPKGAMLSFRNLLVMAMSLHEVDPRRREDE